MNKKELQQNTFIQEKYTNNTRVNVFLTREQISQMNEIKYKYHLSYSAIANIILNEYCTIRVFDDIIHGTNLYKTNCKKTSIKIYGNKQEEWKTPKAINNALCIYLNKMDKDLLKDPKYKNLYEKMRQQIATNFQNTIDQDWDYHTYVRYRWRYERNLQK